MPFFLINKPKGITSRKITSKVQHDLKVKAGHIGTLDPFASGLLIIATDGDTKLIDKFSDFSKTYEGKFAFGKTSSTLDPEGEIFKQKTPCNFTIEKLEEVLKEHFNGPIEQIPPHFSAIKVNGKRAYKLARKSQDFSLNPVKREIFSYEILKQVNENIFVIEFTVSSGTYIRALARDIAKELWTVGMLLDLKRTKIGPFLLEQAQSPEEELSPFADVYNFLNLEEITIDELEIKNLLNGKEIELPYNNKECLFINEKTMLLCYLNEDGNYKIKKRIS